MRSDRKFTAKSAQNEGVQEGDYRPKFIYNLYPWAYGLLEIEHTGIWGQSLKPWAVKLGPK